MNAVVEPLKAPLSKIASKPIKQTNEAMLAEAQVVEGACTPIKKRVKLYERQAGDPQEAPGESIGSFCTQRFQNICVAKCLRGSETSASVGKVLHCLLFRADAKSGQPACFQLQQRIPSHSWR